MATRERKEYEDGSVYEGELRDAKRNGKGTFAWATGDRLVTYPLSNHRVFCESQPATGFDRKLFATVG